MLIVFAGLPGSGKSTVAREQWRDLAERQRAPLVWIEVTRSVPGLHRHRLEGRERDLPGLSEPTWASLETRRPGLAAWTDERVVLDSVRETESNVEIVMEHLRTARVRAIAREIAEEDAELLKRLGE